MKSNPLLHLLVPLKANLLTTLWRSINFGVFITFHRQAFYKKKQYFSIFVFQPNFVEALSYRVAPDPPCLAVSDHSKAGAIKVLPSPGEQPPKSGAKSEVKSDSK